MFFEDDSEFKGKTVQNLITSKDFFKKKILGLNIVGITCKEAEQICNFLSTQDNEGRSCIAYGTLQSYFRKIDLRYQYLHLQDFKLLLCEVKKIKERQQEFTRLWYSLCKKELIGFSELRQLFYKFNVEDNLVDLMLIKFVEQDISPSRFFNKIDSYIEMNNF